MKNFLTGIKNNFIVMTKKHEALTFLQILNMLSSASGKNFTDASNMFWRFFAGDLKYKEDPGQDINIEYVNFLDDQDFRSGKNTPKAPTPPGDGEPLDYALLQERINALSRKKGEELAESRLTVSV